MKRPLKSLALCKSEYIESDPKLDPKRFASQVGSGSKTYKTMGSGSEKIISESHNTVFGCDFPFYLGLLDPDPMRFRNTFLSNNHTKHYNARKDNQGLWIRTGSGFNCVDPHLD
jgi:hypothetical protein